MIGSISRVLTISYSNKDLTKKGKRHNDPLHIIVDAKGKKIPMVLIDDGSTLNVCPFKTMSCLGLSIEELCHLINMQEHIKIAKRNFRGSDTIAHHRAYGSKGGVPSAKHSFMLCHASWAVMDS